MKRTFASEPPFVSPFGYGTCFCGCGKQAPIAERSDKYKGYIKGYPKKFIFGHHKRIPGDRDFVEEDRGYETPCHIWQRRVGEENGYGYCWDGELAHRRSYRLAYGEIPPEVHIHHKCEVRLCGRADHLEIKTPAMHTQERATKLNWEKAREIRRRALAGETRTALAVEFGISPATVGSIRTNRAWREPDFCVCPNCGHQYERTYT